LDHVDASDRRRDENLKRSGCELKILFLLMS
jgi:hypothetical protein